MKKTYLDWRNERAKERKKESVRNKIKRSEATRRQTNEKKNKVTLFALRKTKRAESPKEKEKRKH